MAAARFPFLFHHFGLHSSLARNREHAAGGRRLRRGLHEAPDRVLFLRFVADHVATADAAAARFLIGRPERPSDLTRASSELTDEFDKSILSHPPSPRSRTRTRTG